jgi:transcriptional regulator with XRE-family HTH domain
VSCLVPLVDGRRAAYARLASRILETLNEAVHARLKKGTTKAEIAEKIGCHRSQLSRTLSGSVTNLTLKTISDILWATDFEPQDFKADALESINHNHRSHSDQEKEYVASFADNVLIFDVAMNNDLTRAWAKTASSSSVVEYAS